MRKIRLVIFNEPYWDQGLIYTQNIQPLKELCKASGSKLEIFSFTSIPKKLVEYHNIRKAKSQLKASGIDVFDFPVLFYPTRWMLLRYWLIPYYVLNVFLYIKFFNLCDRKADDNIIYSIRSYQAALGFLLFYKKYERIVFDPRTDWIMENVNTGYFNNNGRTYRFWLSVEKRMLSSFYKTIFISDIFRDNLLNRHKLDNNEVRYPIVYNPVDYNHFRIDRHDDANSFLYTGSLGHWNNFATYLEFFSQLYKDFPGSKLIICTSSPSRKVIPILESRKYDDIRDMVEIYYNVPYNQLPQYYKRCKYGLQLMSKKDSRVGVKFIEYVASGLIPIVNDNVRGAAMLSRKYNIGIVVPIDCKKEQLVMLINNVRDIKVNQENYERFRKLTDLNCISSTLKPIYL